jgi:hypothetical protein
MSKHIVMGKPIQVPPKNAPAQRELGLEQADTHILGLIDGATIRL